MVTVKAQNLSRGDVHRLLGLQPLYDGSFAPLLNLEPLTEHEQQELLHIQQGNPPTYQFMPSLHLFERDRALQLLQVLKAICN